METEEERLKSIFELAEKAHKYGSYARRKELYASEFDCVKQARKVVENNFKYYNEMMNNKMEHTKYMNDFSSTILSIKAGKFIVGSFTEQSGLSFSEKPVTHDTAIEARTECKRLAKLNPGKLFVFVKLAGAELLPVNTTVSI